jgi:serine/threonine protein kinase/beta-lactam-binding protein with PASTA domain
MKVVSMSTMSTMAEQIGRVLAGRYRLITPIGTGSSSRVYAAVDVRLGRQVALKLLHPGLAGDPGFLRRFRIEAQAAAALNHPNVLSVFDWGEDGGEAFIAAELCLGGSLAEMLDGGARLDVAQATLIGAEAAHGLAYAHRRGLVHRDIKPANLLFDEDGRLRIADFGLARASAEAAWTEPIGAVLGTARYASPEQASGSPVTDRSDVYSLALVLYEALTGRMPFSGDTTVALLMARVGASLPPARELGPLAPLLAGAAIPDPVARSDAATLAIDLELLARELPQPRPLPLVAPQVHRSSDATELGDAVRSPTARRRRHRWWLWSLLVLAVAVAASGLAVVKFVVYGHVVPNVVHRFEPAAARAARRDGLRLDVAGRSYSLTVPAGEVLTQSLAPGRHVRSGTVLDVRVSLGAAPVPVPDLAGDTEATALEALRHGHLTASIAKAYNQLDPRGVVVSFAPSRGALRRGGVVHVVISLGPPPVTIPADLDGEGYLTAAAALRADHLIPLERLTSSFSVPAGIVISTSPRGGTSVAQQVSVTLTVSSGPPMVDVPHIDGDSLSTAERLLRAAGLKVGDVIGAFFAQTVYYSSPTEGSSVEVGTTVTLYTF